VLAGLIGAGIQKSLTPALQEREASHHGLQLHYRLFDLERTADTLPVLLEAARAQGYAGLNITFPCKQEVLPLLDTLSDDAAAMGAVNTVVFKDGRMAGHNTDGSGWSWGFRRALPQADMACVVLLGAGGAGSAIAHAVRRMGVGQLRIVDVNLARAQELASKVGATAEPDVAKALQGATGLIHATPTGMVKLPGLPLDAGLLHPGLWVAEIVYFPLETALLKAARAAGCAIVDGGTMAVGQAIGAFELFTGLKADARRMDAHFRELVRQA
jgi:shikimate dehydrogenase